MVAQMSKRCGERESNVRCPVVVHRWFSGGEGWTWGSEGIPEDFVERLAAILTTRPSEPQTGLLGGGPPWWFYHHAPDPEPADPKAMGRQPSVLRAVALPRPPGTQYRDVLAERLAALPLPDTRGRIPGLFLDVPEQWLESAKEPGDSLGKIGEKPARGASAARHLAWRVLLVGVILVCAAAIVGAFICAPASACNGVSSRNVSEKLLKPLGMRCPENASTDEVCKTFRGLYFRQGMVAHLLPGYALDDIDPVTTVIEDIRKSPSDPQPHPDVRFARYAVDQERMRRALEAICFLPTAEIAVQDLTRAVIEVAKNIPEAKREIRGPDKKVAASNAVGLLERSVVTPLQAAQRDGLLRRGQYERWFLEEFRWRVGEPFPWDRQPGPEYRKFALLFCEREYVPDDVRQAATEMVEFLQKRRVDGVLEEDAWERPWFVGRCFLDFLSLKHLQLNEADRPQLESENSLMWQQIKRLPHDGWSEAGGEGTAEPSNPWQMVHKRLQELAKRFDVDTRGSDVVLVQQIANAIAEWHLELAREEDERQNREKKASELEKQRELRQETLSQLTDQMRVLEKEVQKLEAKLSELSLGDPERPKLEQERNTRKADWSEYKKQAERLRDEIFRLTNHLKDVQITRPVWSANDKLKQFWTRLTGQGQKAAEASLSRQ